MTEHNSDTSQRPPTNSKRKICRSPSLGTFAVGRHRLWLRIGSLLGPLREATDDAYVDGNVVLITPQVAGTVVGIDADDTQYVTAGQRSCELDRADAAVALRGPKAELAQTVREVRSLFASTEQLAPRSPSARSISPRRRRTSSGASAWRTPAPSPTKSCSTPAIACATPESALAAAREQLASHRALTDDTDVASHPKVARARRRRARGLPRLPAGRDPGAGVGLRRQAQRAARPARQPRDAADGDRAAGRRCGWTRTSRKGSCTHPRRASPSRLTADANGVEYHGRVAGFGAGTGAAFALLPAQNATGNWIKVVQRLPVRVALDA